MSFVLYQNKLASTHSLDANETDQTREQLRSKKIAKFHDISGLLRRITLTNGLEQQGSSNTSDNNHKDKECVVK